MMVTDTLTPSPGTGEGWGGGAAGGTSRLRLAPPQPTPATGEGGGWSRWPLTWLLANAVAVIASASAEAVCLRNVADDAGPPSRRAGDRLASVPAGAVGVTYVGHSTFWIESPQGVAVATDFNDYVRPRATPDIVTMNIAHSTHYSAAVPPGVKLALQGWGTRDAPAEHDVSLGDVQVRNVPTNIREGGGTYFNGNSIFVIEAGGLCLAHLGHLHHRLTPEHLKQLGHIDVMFVPVDGTWTLGQEEMTEVVRQVGAQAIIPMHYFSEHTLLRFLDRILGAKDLAYEMRIHNSSTILFSRDSLAGPREIVVLRPGER